MANSLDAFIPEFWANESVKILEENMVAAKLVHRDFENQLQKYGDIVNTRKPAEFTALRKTDTDSVTVQDASATNIAVPLDQWLHTTYIITDGDESKSFKSLVDEYIKPASLSLARMADQVILGQAYQFMDNRAGYLGLGTSSTIRGYLVDAGEVMDRNKAWVDGRNMIITPDTKSALLNTDLFVAVNQSGTSEALRRAKIAEALGFDLYMCQNEPEVAVGNTLDITMLVNLTAGYVAGDTVLVVDGISGAVSTGDWITFGADTRPYQITAHTETLGATTGITISPALSATVPNNAVITRYVGGAINLGAGYAAGWSKPMVIDGFTVAPKVGQLVTLGTTTTRYSVIRATTTSLTLDRPLAAAVADDAVVHLGPAGSYNFGFHRNALSFVCRPLATPMSGTGAIAATSNYNGVSMRVTITYDGSVQGHRITHDLLCGVKVLDTGLGCVLFS